MNYLINIGLQTDIFGQTLDLPAEQVLAVATALIEAQTNGPLVTAHAVVQSDSEPTLVLQVEGVLYASTAERLAVRTFQEAIAIYNTQTTIGVLIGPKAQAWGSFSPDLFFLLDGTRLATTNQH